MEFTTTVTDIDVWSLGGDSDDTSSSDFIVKWNADVEARESCLKGISIYPTYVEGSAFISRFDSEKDGYDDEEELVITSRDEGWTLECEGLDEVKLSDCIMPQNVSIDFETKTITVTF